VLQPAPVSTNRRGWRSMNSLKGLDVIVES